MTKLNTKQLSLRTIEDKLKRDLNSESIEDRAFKQFLCNCICSYRNAALEYEPFPPEALFNKLNEVKFNTSNLILNYEPDLIKYYQNIGIALGRLMLFYEICYGSTKHIKQLS